MKPVRSLAIALMLCALPSAAAAQDRGFTNGGWSAPSVPRHGGGHHGGHHGKRFRGAVFIPYYVDREVVIEREVVIREVPVVVESAPPPPPPRKPYKIGASYASLPPGCMKLIEAGASYYLCNGEWYRQTGSGYLAVRAP